MRASLLAFREKRNPSQYWNKYDFEKILQIFEEGCNVENFMECNYFVEDKIKGL